jgi:hypothetical protein
MNFAKSLFSRALLAAALAAGPLVTGAGSAAAIPVYHVDIDTASFKDHGTGYLDLSFLAGGVSGPATATVSHLTGDFGTYMEISPGVSGSVDGQVVFDNTLWADLFREIKLGGHFGFDVAFNGPTEGFGGTDFDVSLYDETGFNFLPGGSSVAHFALKTDDFQVSVNADLASATAVPEPSAAALVLIGLMMAGAVARRRA